MIMKKSLLSDVVNKTLYLSKCSILALTIGSMVVTPAYSKNFIESAMDKILSDKYSALGTSTSAKAFRGATRGYITGGNVSTRVPIWNQKVVSFQPPSVTAGCNGIDAFGGSFSFINADELVQLFRNIAANSVGLLFMLALETVSNEIGVNLKSFQNIIRDINALVSDSCNAAKAVVTLADKELLGGALKTETNQELKMAYDSYGDHFSALKKDFSTLLRKDQQNNAKSNEEDGFYGNVIWQAMKANPKYNTPDLTSELMQDSNLNSDQMKEVLMSLMGTVIIEGQQQDPNAKSTTTSTGKTQSAGTSQPLIPLEPILEISDFIEGFSDKETWICDDNDKCLKPAKSKKLAFGGYAALLYKGLCNADLKKNEACSMDSALGKLANNGPSDLTQTEQNALMSLPPSYRARITRLAILNGSVQKGGPTQVGAVITEHINALAAASVHDLIMDFFIKLENRIKKMPGEYKENFAETLKERKNDINLRFNVKLKTEYGKFDDALQTLDKNYNYVKEMQRISDISFIFTKVNPMDKSQLDSIPSVSN